MVESLFVIFFRITWILGSKEASRSSELDTENPNAESLIPENPTNWGIEVPRSSALLPLLEG